ncbi:folate-binding protein YgfZ [Kordiimonas sp. SCSIO 12610]|uniref:CAF17-like 4Fe-4S cluster assembly/insertion protein YgfZ n=1 Tax=Kordiimonas sp. SCSIO 12610 TaxID=2829597 RepID=UPI00210CABC0|nr:hypothetical protein [Kordiimonas sp. SCSIO 12610]UTW56449.1 folate-binding protein YgfZ [Kordiimonas sp. SCSIO 12610]
MASRGIKLENRSVLRLKGSDIHTFLQGLITNDVNRATTSDAVYAGLLTPQGKYLFDMIIIADNDDLLLDIEHARKDDLVRRLTMYKLRADVDIIDESEALNVWAVVSDNEDYSDISEAPIFTDPRSSALGKRVITESALSVSAMSFEDYEKLRIQNTVPDASRDMKTEKYFWLETNADKLNGVDFDKGCYVGQELTARMKHRTSIKKSLVTLNSKEAPIAEGVAILNDAGKTIGETHSACGTTAIGFVRLEYLKDDATFTADDVAIEITAPSDQ